MLEITQLDGFMTTNKPNSVACTWIGSSRVTSTGTTFTLSGASLGVASSERYILIFAAYRVSSLSTLSMTLDGVPMTKIAEYDPVIGNGTSTAFFILHVPSTATSGTFVLTGSVSGDSGQFSVWTLTGLERIVPYDSAVASNVSGGNLTLANIDVPPGGVLVAACSIISGTSVGGSYTVIGTDSSSWVSPSGIVVGHSTYASAALNQSPVAAVSAGTPSVALAVSLA